MQLFVKSNTNETIELFCVVRFLLDMATCSKTSLIPILILHFIIAEYLVSMYIISFCVIMYMFYAITMLYSVLYPKVAQTIQMPLTLCIEGP